MAATNVFETKLSRRLQVTRYSTPVFAAQASFEERDNLTDGQSVVRPTFGRLYADTYSRQTDLTAQDYAEASETLTVNTTPAVLVPVDKFDAIQHKTDVQDRISKDILRAINKHVDADYLAEVANATSYVDDGDVGGTAGSAITVDQTNIRKIFSAAQRKLQNLDVDIVGQKDPRPQMGNMKPMGGAGFADLTPYVNEQLVLSLSGRETTDGDLVGKNGYKTTYFEFDNFVTTNGYWVGVLGLATNPSDGDTVVINDVTFTFKATLGSTAGNVHIASTVDITRANFASAINAPGTSVAEATDTGFVALSTADQNKLRRMTATNDNSADTLTLAAKGYGYVVVSETLTDATDAWTSEVSHQMFGQKGAVDMVLQSAIGIDLRKEPKQLVTNVIGSCLYGKKTFTEGADALVDVRINSAAWV